MNSKLLITLAAVFLLGILFLVGCSSQLTAPEIQEKLIAANYNLNSYSVDMKINSALVMEAAGQTMSVKSDVSTIGNIDRANKKLYLRMSIKSDSYGMNTAMNTETYAVDNYFYTKAGDAWMKIKLEADVWKQQDEISQILELLQGSKIERLKDETIGRNSYYVIKINPDLKKLLELALKDESASQMFNQSMNFADMVKNYSSTIWVNKETFVIEKSKAYMKIIMTPESMGVTEKNASGKIDMDLSMEIKMADINQQFIINLPEEAKNATDLTELIGAFSQPSQDTEPSSITGNAIAKAFG